MHLAQLPIVWRENDERALRTRRLALLEDSDHGGNPRVALKELGAVGFATLLSTVGS